MFSLRSCGGGLQPETEDRFGVVAEIVKIGILADIGVYVQIVSSSDVGGVIGAGKDNHRNAPKAGMPFDVFQNLKAVLSRHMQIEQH